ncbi:MAG TPA: hypothetical protein VGL24_00840 [Chthoniobacterales bacterium]
MKKGLHLGLETIITAVAEAGRQGEVRQIGALSNGLQAVEKWVGLFCRSRACSLLPTISNKRSNRARSRAFLGGVPPEPPDAGICDVSRPQTAPTARHLLRHLGTGKLLHR